MEYLRKNRLEYLHDYDEERCLVRTTGATAMQYFKSDANMKLLKGLLNAPDYMLVLTQDKKFSKEYTVRRTAYRELKNWGIDAPEPVTSEIIPTKQNRP